MHIKYTLYYTSFFRALAIHEGIINYAYCSLSTCIKPKTSQPSLDSRLSYPYILACSVINLLYHKQVTKILYSVQSSIKYV